VLHTKEVVCFSILFASTAKPWSELA